MALSDLRQGSEHRADGRPGRLAEKVDQLRRGLVGDSDRQPGLVHTHRDHEVLTGHGIRDQRQRVGFRIGLAEVDDRQPGDLGA